MACLISFSNSITGPFRLPISRTSVLLSPANETYSFCFPVVGNVFSDGLDCFLRRESRSKLLRRAPAIENYASPGAP